MLIDPNLSEVHNNLGNIFKEKAEFQVARLHFDKVNDASSAAQSLECTYFLGNNDEFNEQMDLLIEKQPTNIRVASLSAFAAHQLGQKDIYPFCTNAIYNITYANIKNYIKDYKSYISDILNEMNQQNFAWEPKKHSTIGGIERVLNFS